MKESENSEVTENTVYVRVCGKKIREEEIMEKFGLFDEIEFVEIISEQELCVSTHTQVPRGLANGCISSRRMCAASMPTGVAKLSGHSMTSKVQKYCKLVRGFDMILESDTSGNARSLYAKFGNKHDRKSDL